MRNMPVRCWFLLLVPMLVSACASSFATKVTPGVELKDYRTYYVEKHAADDRRIDMTIRDEMQRLGLSATAGPPGNRPADVDAVVTYEDRWMWDITMYMLSLQIDIRSASNNVLLATGKTSYTSLNRQSPEYMAREILMKIFLGKRPGEDEETDQRDAAASP